VVVPFLELNDLLIPFLLAAFATPVVQSEVAHHGKCERKIRRPMVPLFLVSPELDERILKKVLCLLGVIATGPGIGEKARSALIEPLFPLIT
jgi:hypothetical protein